MLRSFTAQPAWRVLVRVCVCVRVRTYGWQTTEVLDGRATLQTNYGEHPSSPLSRAAMHALESDGLGAQAHDSMTSIVFGSQSFIPT